MHAQDRLLKAARSEAERLGRPPSVAEIAAAAGVSKQRVYQVAGRDEALRTVVDEWRTGYGCKKATKAARPSKLREIMAERGVTSAALMRSTGLCKRTMIRARKGLSVSASTMISIAAALGVSVTDVWQGAGS